MWPRYQGVFVRRPVEHDAGDEAVPQREAIVGQWGMIPPGRKVAGFEKIAGCGYYHQGWWMQRIPQ
jgi:hypothetical protein